ncbi:glycosyl transferase family protein [Sphingomonas sp. HITSZ_GF]|uniref:glycosyl transferase family protein n=1 Tax=Sphingomonas sp. HITSZ_GF TaxID=3037247 RepID=UPI00240D726E|nr:glycosyl transferase family protein [Sphingomonas sp. HITSZ_GF]MDG2534382.1 glycosyl transferase family protein [Sphingomonas sp. HITSZ_GF]
MPGGEALIAVLDAVAREATLFAALWFVVGGLDDLLVDLIYLLRRLRGGREALPALEGPVPPGRIVVFVPAWREADVIGAMLRAALARFAHPDYRIYVGTYPNDPETIAAVIEVALTDDRVRLVIGPRPGGTTKADCLNTLWRALLRDEAAEGFTASAVALHDAEDVVHPLELRVYAHGLARHAAVQLPVLPLAHPGSRFFAGHYLDEFAESHGRGLVVRQTVGAALPFAGVGCAIRRDLLGRLAAMRDGAPFDATSLTEDYELGLALAAMGSPARLLRIAEAPGGVPVAVRAYFPRTLDAAVRQKARWMIGIALAGWDRTGWGGWRQIGDNWMRMRDRRATLEIPVLALAYLSILLWGLSFGAHLLARTPSPAQSAAMQALLWANLALLGWRLAVRAAFVGRAYGRVEALWSVPRVLSSNAVALLAARRALFDYIRMLAGAPPRWDKTAHEFPDLAPGRPA